MEGRILVIGATGFIGSAVVRCLAQSGYRIRAMHRHNSRMASLGAVIQDHPDLVETTIADLKQPETLDNAVMGCQAVIHCAGYYPTVSLKGKEEIAKAVGQMTGLLKAAKGAGVSRFVYTSSMSTVGNAPHGTLADESLPYQPGSVWDPYYEAKWEMECLCRAANTPSFQTISLLPTLCVGPGDANRTIFKPFQLTATLPHILYFPGRCNFIDVRIAARAHVAALTRGEPGARYILGGTNTTMTDYFHCIARHLGVERRLLPLPTTLGLVAAWISEVAAVYITKRPPFLPVENINMARHGQHYDTHRARQDLGLESSELDRAVADAVRWYRAQGYL